MDTPEDQAPVANTPEEKPAEEGQLAQATPEQNEVLERIVINAMKIISGKQSAGIDKLLAGGQTAGEGLSQALTFVLQAVVGALQKKGVEISPEIILSENGAASQITQLLVMVIGAGGQDVSPNEIKQALEVGISNFGVKQAKPSGPPQQPGMPPEGMEQGMDPVMPPPGLIEGAQQ